MIAHGRIARFIVLAALTLATGIVLVVSLRGNFLYGYGLGQTEEKRLLFGWANVGADIWKSFGLIAVSLLWRAKHRRAACAATLAWVMCLLFGINSALGVYVQDRTTLIGNKEATHATYQEVQAELASIEEKLHARTSQRSVAEIDADIAAILARPVVIDDRVRGTVGTMSQQCATLTTRTREACVEVSELRREHAAAQEVTSLEERAAALRAHILDLRERGGSLADPVAEFYAWLTNGFVSARDAGFGFPLFFAMLIEAVSAFGPVTIAAYAEASRAEARHGTLLHAVSGDDAPRHAMAGNDRPRDILLWIAERATPVAANRAIGLDRLYADYKRWCDDDHAASLQSFEDALDRARELPELVGKIRKFKDRYYGIGLVHEKSIGVG